MQNQSILVFGANGCGKTTLAKKLAEALHYRHLDMEDYAFGPSPVPYGNPLPIDEVHALLRADMNESFVLSAVTGNIGPDSSSLYQYAILLSAPSEVRRTRMEQRSLAKFGARALPGGDLYNQEQDFLSFAVNRSLAPIEAFAKTLTCPLLRLDASLPAEEIFKLALHGYQSFLSGI